jgi:hypothetical protein
MKRRTQFWVIASRLKGSKASDREMIHKDTISATRLMAWKRLNDAWGGQNVDYWRNAPVRDGGLLLRAVKVTVSWEARR